MCTLFTISVLLTVLLLPLACRSQNNRPGVCPALQPGQSGACIGDCNDDHNCASGQKCCPNGCSKSCTTPVASPNDVIPTATDTTQTPTDTTPTTTTPTPVTPIVLPPAVIRKQYCPGGSVSIPQFQLNAALKAPSAPPQPAGAQKLPTAPGLTSPFQALRAPGGAGAGAAISQVPVIDPPPPLPPACSQDCSSNVDCTAEDNICCNHGCQQHCTLAVADADRSQSCADAPSPCRPGTQCVDLDQSTSRCVISTCALTTCPQGTYCLDYESGATCVPGAPNNGQCPVSTDFYGGGYQPCNVDSECQDTEKCCPSQWSGFVCTPVQRPMPINCTQVYCSGNRVCTTGPYGLPHCVRNKRGQCPYYQVNGNGGPLCDKECGIDLDCQGNRKCCQVGCNFWCLAPDLSGTCSSCGKICEHGFVCREDEWGWGSCVERRPKVGICPSFPIPFLPVGIRPCLSSDQPDACLIDADCQGNQKCCRTDWCHGSVCTDPLSSCDNVYSCQYNERCRVVNGIAQCVKGLCPTTTNAANNQCRPPPPPWCDVSGNNNCGSRVCCTNSCGQDTCVVSGTYCGSDVVCKPSELCLFPFYPVEQNFSCVDPNSLNLRAAVTQLT